MTKYTLASGFPHTPLIVSLNKNLGILLILFSRLKYKIHSQIFCFVDCASLYNLVNRAYFVHNLVQHLVFVTLHEWLSGTQGGIPPYIPDSHPHRVTYTECRIDTVIFPDDRHINLPKHVEKRNKYTKKNCAPSCLYLQDHCQMLSFDRFHELQSDKRRVPNRYLPRLQSSVL